MGFLYLCLENIQMSCKNQSSRISTYSTAHVQCLLYFPSICLKDHSLPFCQLKLNQVVVVIMSPCWPSQLKGLVFFLRFVSRSKVYCDAFSQHIWGWHGVEGLAVGRCVLEFRGGYLREGMEEVAQHGDRLPIILWPSILGTRKVEQGSPVLLFSLLTAS